MKITKKILVLALVLVSALTFISFADTGGESNSSFGVIALLPPAMTIFLAFATKNTLISMFAGIWLGSTIINKWNILEGLMGSFSSYIIPQMSDSWNAGMLVLIALIGGFMYMINACGGAEALGRWAQKYANTRKKRN